MVYPVPLSSKTLVMVRSEAGWGSIHFNFLERSSEGYVQSDPVGDMNDYFQVGNIFRILKRTRIDLELRSQWPEVGVVGVTACAPASTHFSDFILQTTRLFLVSQDVCELYSIIFFFYFIKIYKSLFGSRQDEAFFPKQSICLQRCNPSFAAFAFVNRATTAGFVLIKANIATLIVAWDLWSFRLGLSRCKVWRLPRH